MIRAPQCLSMSSARSPSLQALGLGLALTICSALTVSAQISCRKVEFKADLKKGDTFQQAVSPRLTFLLKATASGWQIQMLPGGTPPPHDAAEVATPPYQSINPLLLTTDYGLRAQDAVAWNPRPFEFAIDESAGLLASRDLDLELDKLADASLKKDAETRLIALAMKSAHGEVRILDSSLVPGTADQSAAAATVASHWRTTPHSLVQPAPGSQATALGSLESLRVQVTLWLPRSVPLAAGLRSVPVACPQ